jgi:hypothetical protein
MKRSSRLWAGVLLKDLPIYLPALARGGEAHLAIRNRGERLEPAPHGSGYRCDWRWTSDLHAPRFIPALGRHLMRRALAAHPIGRAPVPGFLDAAPQISFLIGHRGTARLPHLLGTLESLAAQRGAHVECIVVEQDAQLRLAGRLPAWVRLIHAPAREDMPYCRSWSFNVGAQHARAPVLVLHDNDMLLPADYAAEVLARIARGFEAVNLKRFIFYLTREHTQALLAGRAGLLDAAPEVVVQNLEAGGSVAITREAFDRIGGMDESFVGWGGEDNEFWERAATLKVWPWAHLPIVHLWHEAQPGKHDQANATAQLYAQRARIDPRQRIEQLRGSRRGDIAGPAGWPRPGAN